MKTQAPRFRLRLPNYDYPSAGAYFITVCVKRSARVLCEVTAESVILTEEGTIVQETWNELPIHYSGVDLDEFVVRPNHVHGILWIADKEEHNDDVAAGLKPAATQHGLGEIVRGFKSLASRRINERLTIIPAFGWQRSFHDHVIRDDEDFYQHRKYILENPPKWMLDRYFASR